MRDSEAQLLDPQVRPLALDRPLELVERDGERPAEGLQIRSRERPVDVDDLPLPSLEVEDVGRARLDASPSQLINSFTPAQPTDPSSQAWISVAVTGKAPVSCICRAQIARVSLPRNHAAGSVPIIRVPAWSESRPRYASSSPAAIAMVHRSTTRRISSEGSTRRMVRHRCRWTQPAGRRSNRRHATTDER